MSLWERRLVPFKFQLSDWSLFSVSLPLQVRSGNVFGAAMTIPVLPDEAPVADSQGFLVRGQPVDAELPIISRSSEHFCYVPLQYRHCYIDLGLSFDAYQDKFSSKTRATIKRKARKYAEHCGGTLRWKAYSASGEVEEFLAHARAVSKLSYQERLLDAGIPDSEEFARQAGALAAEDRMRGYILFDGERPVSYLYCPAHEGVLMYAYLGYDPEYMRLSVGTVLQWLAVEALFAERRFKYFDFTEGESEHKLLFATHQRQCANVFFIRRSLRNTAIIYGQVTMNRFSSWLGAIVDRLGLKAKIKRLLRFSS